MEVKLRVDGKGKLEAFIRTLQPGSRAHLHTVGANALSDHVRRHLRSVAPSRHATADRLGGRRTMHIENAIGSVVPHADATHGEVVIPIAGIGRAFHDITITPKIRKSLTIPISKYSYGKTAWQLQSRGWKFFVRKSKKEGGFGGDGILYGKRRNGETIPLYKMTKKVVLKRDPSLLPTQAEASKIVVKSIATECKRIIRNAH